MVAISYSRGHKIEYNLKQYKWIYSDNRKIFNDSRPCLKCRKYLTKEGYDSCLGYIKGVKSACCGYEIEKRYIL